MPDKNADEFEAAIARLEVELARAKIERDEALAQRAATAEVLQIINASPGDLAPVFEVMLDKALELCEANYGYLLTYDGEGLVPVADRGNPAFSAWVRERGKIVPEPGTINARIIGGEPVVQVADVINDPFYQSDTAMRRAVVEIGGFRTVLTVALRKDELLLGVIHVYRQEVRPFSARQIALLQNFAAQAVIAMENARLITETREALDQQTATAEVLQVINSSPGDLHPVWEAMLERAMRLCDAAFGVLMRYDGEMFHPVAHHGLPPPFAAYLEAEQAIGLQGVHMRLVEGAPLVHLPDAAADPDAHQTIAARRAFVDLGRARTVLLVPLRKDGALRGSFAIYRQEVRPFTDKQIALLLNFAAQAVIAMENARLLIETRESLERQTATSDILRVIAASPGDAEGTLRKIAETTMRLFEAAGTSFRIADGDAYSSAIIVGRGAEDFSASLSDPNHLVQPRTLPGTVIHEDRQIHLPDLDNLDPAFADWPGPPIFRRAGMRTLVGTPLRRRGQAFGALIVYRDILRPFTCEELQLLQSFADQAMIAMENARLLGELRQRTDEVAELNRGLEARIAAQLAELERGRNLRRFLPPQLAEMVVSQGDEKILESHRREIVVVFADVRGYTTFTETAEPEEVIEFLGQYHAVLGPLITRFEGTLSHFFGDGLMVFFNDPVPCPDPAQRAIGMALAMRDAAGELMAAWRRRGHRIGFGAGIAQGYATLGQIGFAERMDYTAIGTVTNLAARLCDAAKDGQILISSRIATAVEDTVTLEGIGEVALKGLSQAAAVFNVVQ